MFSGALDLIRAFGWPYHGLVIDNELELPSGRKVPCRHVGWDTQLWDVGMPDPGIVADDPDEQWWPRSIIRGGYQASESGAPRIYSGLDVDGQERNLCPMLVEGTSARLNGAFFEASMTVSGEVSITLRYGGVAPLLINRSVLGVPNDVLLFSAIVIDGIYTRGRCIVSVRGINLDVLALVEARVIAVGDGFGIAYSVIAGYSQCCFWTAVDDQTFNIPPSQRVGWLNGNMITEDQWPPATPPPALGFIPIGEHVARARGHVVANAWYDRDGELRVQNLWVEAETLYRCIDPEEFYRTVVTIERGSFWLESGGVETSPINFERHQEKSNIYEPYTGHLNHEVLYVQGEVVIDDSGIGGAGPGPSGLGYYDYHAWAGSDGAPVPFYIVVDGVGQNWTSYFAAHAQAFVNRLSNKLAQPCVRARGAGDYISWYGDALHPHGVAPGIVVHDIRDGALPHIARGTYNPITGQVVRNPTGTHRYSWV